MENKETRRKHDTAQKPAELADEKCVQEYLKEHAAEDLQIVLTEILCTCERKVLIKVE